MTFEEMLEKQRPDQDNYDRAVAMSERFKKATESPDWNENPYFNLEDAAKASRNPVNRVYNTDDLKNITSDVGTIAWDSFRKGVMDLQSVGDKADMALGNTLAGISGNTLGTELRDRAADSLMKTMEESRFVDSNYGDAETWTSRFVGGGMSMAEMLAVGAATGMAGLGAYVGTLSLSDGALNDMVKYQEEHGNLDGYETNPVNLALDYGNAVFQVASELMLGTGRLASGKFLKAGKTGSAIAKEALDNFIQESAQGAASDVTEILKGNKDIDVLKENAIGYIKDGIVAGVLGGAIGGSAYKLNKNRALQNLDKINAALNPSATQEEIRQKSEEVFAKTEEKALKTFVPELIAQNEAINDKGSIRDNLQKKVTAMYDESEDMSEQQKAKAIEATTTLELENILYDSVERKIPLTANPLLQGEVNELGWFREGVPENRRDEIESLRQEYVDLRAELKKQNESEQKNYEKIEELENKIELFRKELPNKLQDLVVADRAELRKMLEEQRERVATNKARKRIISQARKRNQTAIKAQLTAENKLAEQMARGAEKARIQRENRETAQQTKEAKIRSLQEQREISRVIKGLKVTIAQGNKGVDRVKSDTLRAIRGGDIDIIKDILSKNKFITRDLSGTQIKNLAKLNWELFQGKDLGVAQSRGAIQVPLRAIEQNVVSGNDVLLRAGYTQEQIDNMDDETWERLVTAEYRKEQPKEPEQPELSEEVLDQIGDIYFQEQFDLANENARLDDIYPEYKGETINIDGKERSVYNSNGERIAKSEEALRNFYKWFGDSKVVDEQGRPQVCYHATNAVFDTFDKEKQGTGHGSALGKGFYFSTYQYQGEDYGKNVMPVYLKIEEPMTIEKLKSQLDDIIRMYLKDGATQKDIEFQRSYVGAKTDSILEMADFLDGISRRKGIPYSEILNKLGFDGIFFREQRIAFEPNQIKSVDNRGTYSSDTGNIYKQTQMQAKTTGGKDTYRGAYLPEYRFIAKTANMDASTLNHELAHDWGQEYFRWARSGRASESFLRSWGAVEKAIGITDKDTYFTYDASEKFARAYEGWLLQKKDWAKILKIDNDDDKKAVESMMEDYRQELVDIYESLLESSKYFKDTYGKVGELKPELVDFFERAVNYDSIDVRVKRGEITQEQATEEKLNEMLENSVNASVESMPVEQVKDADAIMQIQDLQQTANDTEKFEVEGGNKKALQKRLDNIALAQDLTQNDKDLGKYDSHRDMLAVAEQADEFVKTRREDALAIINGEMAEQDGLYASDLYTALEREANATGDFELIQELRNSKIANEMAKELGQRVAGFRNYKGSGDVDVVSVLNSLDKKLKESYNKNKDKADEYIGDLVAELKIADNNAKLDEFFDEMECR